MSDIKYESIPIDDLTPHPRNPRRGNVELIAESIRTNGFYGAVLVQTGTKHIIAGNHRWKAAKQVGMETIPVVWADVDDETALRILLADNRLSDIATNDDEVLLALLQQLEPSPMSLLGTGYDDEVFAQLVSSLDKDPIDPDDAPVPDPPADPVTQRGDIWKLGDHRLMCGDSRNEEDFKLLMDGSVINVAFTSPPYAEQRKYDESSEFKPVLPSEYVEWFAPVAENIKSALASDGSWFVNVKPSVTPDGLDTDLWVLDLVVAHVRQWGWHFVTEFCWERNGIPKQVAKRFKNQFEPIYQFTLGDWKLRPESVRHWSENVPIAGGPGVGNTNWADAQGGNAEMFGGEFTEPGMAYPGNRLPTFSGTHEALGHTAAFPVGLPAWFIRAFSDVEDVVFDPFMGSGSTLIAADREGRVAMGMEISPAYCDMTIQRWKDYSGGEPVLLNRELESI